MSLGKILKKVSMMLSTLRNRSNNRHRLLKLHLNLRVMHLRNNTGNNIKYNCVGNCNCNRRRLFNLRFCVLRCLFSEQILLMILLGLMDHFTVTKLTTTYATSKPSCFYMKKNITTRSILY